MPRLTLQDLLNPADTPNIPPNPIPQNTTPSPAIPIPVHLQPNATILHTDYKLNHKTNLSKVYQYAVSAFTEYPETGATFDDAIGHLFEMDPQQWYNPARNFAYSRGRPDGQISGTSTVSLLVSSITDERVPCTVRHSTCQGVKVCPYYDANDQNRPHSTASNELLHERLRTERELRLTTSSPIRDVFERTSAYIQALVRNGCRSEATGPTRLNHYEAHQRAGRLERDVIVRRGRMPQEGRCEGRMVFDAFSDGTPVVRCEHHSPTDRDHFCDATIGYSSLDLEYLEAVLCEDQEEIERLEQTVEALGFGPRTQCRNVTNVSTQRPYCLISCGPHTHPIPVLDKTPVPVQIKLQDLLLKLDDDLPDITPRKLLAHSVVKAYLRDRFPLLRSPTISDLHISLSNRSHLKVFIDAVKRQCFPEGTGWKGLLHLKAQQDALLDPKDWYIQRVIEIPLKDVPRRIEDDQWDQGEGGFDQHTDVFRLVVCMTPEGSERLGKSQFNQSDIAFKQVVGYYEFEVAGIDRSSNTDVTFCRIYLTRRNAEAHCLALRMIDEILQEDIGRGMHFRHIHGEHVNNCGEGLILNWVVDQDRAQALGLGLRLQEISRQFPGKRDLHEPQKLLIDLSPYDHLLRFLTLCIVHFLRNIRSARVSEEVRNLMRSLHCIEHPNWDETIAAIRTLGEKAGSDWLADKESLPFAFPALCWERSFIPRDIWLARPTSTNAVEAAHRDVNREGLKSLKIFEDSGVRESYGSKHLFESTSKNMQHKDTFRQKKFKSVDGKLNAHNEKVSGNGSKLTAAKTKADEALLKWERSARISGALSDTTRKAHEKWEKAQGLVERLQRAYDASVAAGEDLVGTGSGKVGILLPPRRVSPS
ncbi:hypothetical protein V5O48_010432 [Marasmius crinis-equi]|uniref:Uncharacterized protein n=1 Tax=Marasmius crinis-equi TaxID=585013 RepID=A0ABR3F8G5_9AGAR